MSKNKMPKTSRTTIKRGAKRAVHEREMLYQILDESMVIQVGFLVEDHVRVIPTAHWRVGDRLYIHGARGNVTLKSAMDREVCLNATILDGLVFARSAFHHSMNYRNAVIFGQGVEVVDEAEKLALLAAFVEKVSPGRWQQVRQPNQKEMNATIIVGFDLTEVSVKVRQGPPNDHPDDLEFPTWAGVIPLRAVAGPAVAAPDLKGDWPTAASPSGIAQSP